MTTQLAELTYYVFEVFPQQEPHQNSCTQQYSSCVVHCGTAAERRGYESATRLQHPGETILILRRHPERWQTRLRTALCEQIYDNRGYLEARYEQFGALVVVSCIRLCLSSQKQNRTQTYPTPLSYPYPAALLTASLLYITHAPHATPIYARFFYDMHTAQQQHRKNTTRRRTLGNKHPLLKQVSNSQ